MKTNASTTTPPATSNSAKGKEDARATKRATAGGSDDVLPGNNKRTKIDGKAKHRSLPGQPPTTRATKADGQNVGDEGKKPAVVAKAGTSSSADGQNEGDEGKESAAKARGGTPSSNVGPDEAKGKSGVEGIDGMGGGILKMNKDQRGGIPQQ